MIIINPWWIHHCAGTLEPENDPYSEEFEGIDFGSISKKDLLKIGAYLVILITIITLFFMWFVPWVITLIPKIGGLLSIIIGLIGVILLITIILFSAIKIL